jgi:hypothetical protein
MAQGFTKLPTKQHTAKSKHIPVDKKKKMGKGLKRIAPKKKGAILTEQVKKRFSAKLGQKIEDSSIAKSIAKSGDHFSLLNNNINKSN